MFALVSVDDVLHPDKRDRVGSALGPGGRPVAGGTGVPGAGHGRAAPVPGLGVMVVLHVVLVTVNISSAGCYITII